MSEFGWLASTWLLRTLAAGGVLLLLSWLALRFVADPARRQRLAAWTVRGAVLTAVLGFFPAWLTIPIAREEAKPAPKSIGCAIVAAPVETEPSTDLPPVEEWVLVRDCTEPVEVLAEANVATAPASVVPPPAAPPVEYSSLLPLLLTIYGAVGLLAVLHLGVATVALMRLRRSSKPAPEAVLALTRELAEPHGVIPDVRVSTRLASPVCFGWLRPVVMLPKSLLDSARADELRWVLAHELDHLRRGDPRTTLWLGLARAVYFALPWFWALRRELRLAQEYLADAAAAAGRPADYAAFLVSLSGMPARRRTPLGAVAVRAGRTDLYRRVSMLTQSKRAVSDGCSRGWSLLTAGGAIAAAVTLSGIGFADDKKPEKTIEGRVIIIEDDQPRKDGDKKPGKKDGDKGVEKKVELRIVVDTPALMKAVNAALEKGDVEAAKKAMAKLSDAMKAQPNVMMFHGDAIAPHAFVPGTPHVAPLTGLPDGVKWAVAPPAAPSAPAAPTFRARVIDGGDEAVKKMEEKLSSLKKALESVKDSPEAREALEKTIGEFKKKIEEARAHGKLKVESIPDGTFRWQLAPGQADAARAHAEAARADAERALRVLEKQMAELKDNPEAAAALKAAREKLEKHLADTPKIAGLGGGNLFGPAAGKTFSTARAGEGRLGVMIAPVPDALADQMDLKKGGAILITGVTAGSPAEKAGLKANDILLKIADRNVGGEADVVKLVRELKPDEKFDILIIRKGKRETVKDVLIPAPTKKRAEESDSGKGEKREAKFNSMNVNVNDGEFTIEAKDDAGSVHIAGTFDDGTPVPSKIVIVRGDSKDSYTSLDKLPKSDRARVEQLLKNVRGSR